MTRLFEIPEATYEALLATAREAGQTPVEWLAARVGVDLPKVGPGPGEVRAKEDLLPCQTHGDLDP